jgi:DNA anti-recombination protein RmuC
MKRVTKADSEQLESFARCLREKHEEITAILAEINSTISGELNQKIAEYNGILNDADELRNEIVGRMEDYSGERSEKWSESEAGENYTAWMQEWQDISLEEIEAVDELTLDDFDEADEIEALNHGPSEN